MIKGLDNLTKQLEQAQRALKSIDGELGAVTFDPKDPGSIEAAIHQMEAMIDDKLGPYLSNPMIGQLAQEMKESYRAQIVERAAAARLERDGE